MNLAQAKSLVRGATLYHGSAREADGTPQAYRVSGKPKTWSRWPDHVEIPVRRVHLRGTVRRGRGIIATHDLGWWHLTPQTALGASAPHAHAAAPNPGFINRSFVVYIGSAGQAIVIAATSAGEAKKKAMAMLRRDYPEQPWVMDDLTAVEMTAEQEEMITKAYRTRSGSTTTSPLDVSGEAFASKRQKNPLFGAAGRKYVVFLRGNGGVAVTASDPTEAKRKAQAKFERDLGIGVSAADLEVSELNPSDDDGADDDYEAKYGFDTSGYDLAGSAATWTRRAQEAEAEGRVGAAQSYRRRAKWYLSKMPTTTENPGLGFAGARTKRESVLRALGTLAHNRRFTPREVSEYVGFDAASTVRRFFEDGVIEKVPGDPGAYYPTPTGWRLIESAQPTWARGR